MIYIKIFREYFIIVVYYYFQFEVNKPSRSQSIYVLPATNEDLLYAQLMRCNISKLPEAKIQ